ncbi:GAF domain-containing sensor histidine kinase [Pelobacter propionicus]|uniref:histidine kinase n=1 Tax=Pelobacter propionicus (strain DSM 2379 / NBRC 103807 / OttBd1) TaxID=338966 RepID=A1AL34_PELPD|nr:GAF domain-containing sensor histidine kinase [Pelobacter propionicus]ABK98054.1 GAF sensor signal transduction histidine kinase [Pelobacter propionicus DSM 2379]
MENQNNTPHCDTTDKKLNELALLYQLSNTLLSTIRLNKLIHLILTALTSGPSPLFQRAMLFLHNEKSRTLQGMLGVTSDTSERLVVEGDEENRLSNRWDISDQVIAHQRATNFCNQVRSTRIDIDGSCQVISKVMVENVVYHAEQPESDACPACLALRELGVYAFAAVPLMARDKNLGMIAVDNPGSGAKITLDDLHFLQLFANQAGMAVENSMLYNRVEEAHSNLRDARERLIRGERLAAVGEMAAKLAHELKNPLITIGGFSWRLIKNLATESPEYRYADIISKEVCRLERMLTDILSFTSKPMVCFDYGNCDLEEILGECFEVSSTPLEENNVSLTTSFSGGPWIVLGDAHQLKQVFLNLILNACECMTDGGALEIGLQKVFLDKNSVMISISDTGGGIHPDMLPRIFDPFFTTKPQGSGLGLAIVKRIMLNHNGSIDVENGERGAVFTLTLPLI